MKIELSKKQITVLGIIAILFGIVVGLLLKNVIGLSAREMKIAVISFVLGSLAYIAYQRLLHSHLH